MPCSLQVKHLSRTLGKVTARLQGYTYDADHRCAHHHSLLEYEDQGVTVGFDLLSALVFRDGQEQGEMHNMVWTTHNR